MADYERMPIILDTGSSLCKAGFAGDDAPKAIFPTIVGRLLSDESVHAVGRDAIKNDYVITEPVQGGMVRSWDDLQLIWKSAFDRLEADPVEHAVLIPDHVGNPGVHREKMAQILFEEFQVPSLNINNPSVLNIMAAGRGTSLSVEMGHGQITLNAIYEGYLITEAQKKINIGGNTITKFLGELLETRGKTFQSVEDKFALKEMKEKLCFASKDYEGDISRSSDLQETFDLPDGSSIVIGRERFECVEALFQNHLLGMDEKGLHNFIHQSINACDMSCRPDICANIVLSGGCSNIPFFKDRLHAELKSLFPEKLKLNVIAQEHRAEHTWIGGSIYAALSYFPQNCVTKEEFAEQGAKIISQKFQ